MAAEAAERRQIDNVRLATEVDKHCRKNPLLSIFLNFVLLQPK